MNEIQRITTGFLAGNLVDETAPHAYAESLRQYLEAAYPGVEIEVDWQPNASGYTPLPLQTHVYMTDPEDPDDAALVDIEETIYEHDRAYWHL